MSNERLNNGNSPNIHTSVISEDSPALKALGAHIERWYPTERSESEHGRENHDADE